MDAKSGIAIESRIQLFSALAEAGEVEHNLMCLYLYAMFSLKRTEAEGLSAKELKAVDRWRKVILGVALEEMTHLTLVSNLCASIGGSPNFMRPNFPSSPGLYPAGIVIELARFEMSTLDHFIFLERPRSEEIEDGESFQHVQKYTRLSERGRLMPTSGDYQTVGDLYLSIRSAFEELCSVKNESDFLCGSVAQQIGPLDSSLPGLSLIRTREDALKAIDTIITQGEGATDVADSHYQRFLGIKKEYLELLKENPNFTPARGVARNPVMRKPLNPENRVWVTEPLAARYMDLANTLYTMMLRTLVQLYAIDQRPKKAKATLLNCSYGLMHAMSSVAETLTYLPVTNEQKDIFSGMSFAMVRSLAPLERHAEKRLFRERYLEVISSVEKLQRSLESEAAENPMSAMCSKQLQETAAQLKALERQIGEMPESTEGTLSRPTVPSAPIPPTGAPAKESAKTASASARAGDSNSEIEISETEKIKLLFEAKRCIHSRHCVTELPNVFKANTPGKWIFAENAEAEILAGVARECPSGAIQYRRKDGGPEEPVPDVNIMRIRENGPYAFLGELEIDGRPLGMRATLCRCGQSQNKPFCDGSHNTAKFVASGEPAKIDDTALNIRSGTLAIDRTQNGPLSIRGNVEICAGTGKVVLRTDEVRLCRCGHSKNKPVCDNSHVAANFIDKV
jgi:CDGSH-type Zn-finger protein/uncharacterized Fe-S cluster protein YjdI